MSIADEMAYVQKLITVIRNIVMAEEKLTFLCTTECVQYFPLRHEKRRECNVVKTMDGLRRGQVRPWIP